MKANKNHGRAERDQRPPVHGTQRERKILSAPIIDQAGEDVKADLRGIVRAICEALRYMAMLIEWRRWNRLARKMLHERQPWAAQDAAEQAEAIRARMEGREAA